MRTLSRLLAILFGVSTMWSFAAAPAHAEDAVDQAVTALRSSSVYVAPDTEGTTKTTASELAGLLKDGDHIVIVMLPAGSTALSSSDVAAKILGSLKESGTLGLYVNGDTFGYSTRLPMSAIPDLMARAKSIARTPQESLTIFVKLVHEYQAAHPEPTPTPTQAGQPAITGSESGINGGGIFVFSLLLAAAVAAVSWNIYTKRRGRKLGTYPIRNVPPQIADQLHKIKSQMEDITSHDMTGALGDIINDTCAFFKRSRNVSRDEINGFAQRLRTANELLVKYIDIQNNPRYVEFPDALLESGVGGIKKLSATVLKAVRSKNAQAVLDFQMAADIMSADINYDLR